jgi:hypothetical protein
MKDIREVSRNFTRDCWIITRDISAYFPSSDLDRSYAHYRTLIEESFPEGDFREDLLYILLRTNYAYPGTNARLRSERRRWDPIIAAGKSVIFNGNPARGACLGNQYWQVEKNFDLNGFDHFQVDECGMHYVRFVDDMVWVVDNLQAGLAHVALSERLLLEQYGYRMHPRKRYQQHYTKGGEFIGTWFRMDRVYVGNRVVRNARKTFREWNRNPSRSRLPHFLSSVNSYLGMLKHKNAYGIIRDLVDLVSPKWLQWCHYNDDRRCFEANPGSTFNELLLDKYHFKLSRHHGKARATKRPGVPAA